MSTYTAAENALNTAAAAAGFAFEYDQWYTESDGDIALGVAVANNRFIVSSEIDRRARREFDAVNDAIEYAKSL